MPGQARMLVECGPEAVLAAVTVKKSATENSQLNKQRSYRHVGRYSGSFSPPGIVHQQNGRLRKEENPKSIFHYLVGNFEDLSSVPSYSSFLMYFP